MNSRYFHIGLAIWLAVAVRPGFAESFQYRPTHAGMDDAVALGTEIGYGARERCQATQYATNPVSYRVAPPDLSSGWYLDQETMAGLDVKIKALVPYYMDSNTVFDGSTEIVGLTVTGLWAQLEIGDGTSQFTQIPASGTNAATYGEWPRRIYEQNLVERYQVLEALEIGLLASNGIAGEPSAKCVGFATTWQPAARFWYWSDAYSNWAKWVFVSAPHPEGDQGESSGIECVTYGYAQYPDIGFRAFIRSFRGVDITPPTGLSTNIAYSLVVSVLPRAPYPEYYTATQFDIENVVFDDNGIGFTEGERTVLETNTLYGLYADGTTNSVYPAECAAPIMDFYTLEYSSKGVVCLGADNIYLLDFSSQTNEFGVTTGFLYCRDSL